jgi:hypothetical protein
MSTVLLTIIAGTAFVVIMIAITATHVTFARDDSKRRERNCSRRALIKDIRLGHIHVEDLSDEVLVDVLDHYHSGDTWDICVRDIARRRLERLPRVERLTSLIEMGDYTG